MYLIDADKTEWFQIKCTDGGTYVLIKQKHLFDLPRVDAVPVVRCEKCRWYNPVFYACDKHGICKPVDWFCADGEEEHDVRNGKE